MKVLSVLVAILIWSFVFSYSVEAKIFKWVDENGTIHYSDKPPKKLDKLRRNKLKNTKARVSLPHTALPKTVQKQKNVREESEETAWRLINLKGRIDTCQDLPEKIELCEPYACEMPHHKFNVSVIHSISDMKDGKCHYEQTMPNNGLMTCKFSQWQKKQYAQLTRDMLSGKSIEGQTSVEKVTSINIDVVGKNKLQSRIIKEKTSYKLDGKETEKMFNDAIKNGNCVIEGN